MPYIFIIPAAVIVVLLIAFITESNKFSADLVKIDEAESDIDVALTKRYDVLTKQLSIVKGYAAHESDTLGKLVELRKGMSVSEKTAASASMDDMQRKISILAESYPELRSSQNFSVLQASVNDAEEHLGAARRAYNAAVSAFNRRAAVFPSCIVAGLRRLKRREFFRAEEEKKNDVRIEF